MSTNVLASKHYISFLVTMGDDGTLGCHLPRSDAVTLLENTKQLLQKNEYFPEIEFETDNMEISGMSAGTSIMFCCTNNRNEKQVQFAMEKNLCRKLMEQIEGVSKSALIVHGPPNSESFPWKFFQIGQKKVS